MKKKKLKKKLLKKIAQLESSIRYSNGQIRKLEERLALWHKDKVLFAVNENMIAVKKLLMNGLAAAIFSTPSTNTYSGIDRSGENPAENETIAAVDAETGTILWEKEK